jgi:hypothetical protein
VLRPLIKLGTTVLEASHSIPAAVLPFSHFWLKSKSQKHLLPAKVITMKKHADGNIWEACCRGKCNSLKKMWREGVEEWDFFPWPHYSSIHLSG